MQFCVILLERSDRYLEHVMIWLIMALVILFPIVLAGRAHSRYLDAQQARWAIVPRRDDVVNVPDQTRAQSRVVKTSVPVTRQSAVRAS